MNRKELYGLFAVLTVVAAGLALQSVMSRDAGSSFRILPGRGATASGGALASQASRSGAAQPGAAGAGAAETGTSSAESSGKSDAFRPDGRLDLNRATAGDLQAVDRVGPQRARAIVAYRERAGRFRDLHELENVPGIGEKTRLALESFLFVEGAAGITSLAAAAGTTATVVAASVSGAERSSSGAPLAEAAPTPSPAIGIEPVDALAPRMSAPQKAAVPVLVAPAAPVLAAPTTSVPLPPAIAGAKPANAVQTVNINTAGETELEALWNVGPVKAKAIVQWRQAHGAFRRPEDLDRVPGIGPETVRRNLPMIAVGP